MDGGGYTQRMGWTAVDIPDLRGTIVLVTGATSGIGLEVTKALAAHGAHVVLGTRNADKTARVLDDLTGESPSGSLEHLPLDLSDLSSVRQAARTFAERHARLDRLVNNAGVMATPRRTTAQGHELQFGTNHVGHFALTRDLLPVIRATPGARVVTVSSGLHRQARLDLDDLDQVMGTGSYDRWGAYARSKLANLLFTLELQRRFEEAGDDAVAVAAHPGYTATGLQTTGPGMERNLRGTATVLLSRVANVLFGRSAAVGARPVLYATTAPGVAGGSYWGPTGFAETRGPVGPASRSDHALDPAAARRLWTLSEQIASDAPHAA